MLWSIVIIVTWTYAGYNMLIMYSNLQAIDQDIYEAARIDGANVADRPADQDPADPRLGPS